MTLEEIKQLVEETLKRLTVEFDTVEIEEREPNPRIQIKTQDSGALIGPKGENLRSLNYLIKKMVEQLSGEEYTQFLLDVNGYQMRNIEKIRSQARMLAQRAKMFRYDVEMSPMNSYERMIVHSTFTDDSEIETQSQGEGKFRRVVIHFKTEIPDSVENNNEINVSL